MLSENLMQILDTATRSGATHIDILQLDETSNAWLIRWLRGAELVATGQLPDGAFNPLSAELGALGAKLGDLSRISVKSPVGPMGLGVALGAHAIHIVLREEATADAEDAFSELMGHLDSVKADRVTCAHGEARFDRDGKGIESVPLVDGAIAILVAHGKTLGSLNDTKRQGDAVLYGKGGPRKLRIELVDDGVAFTVG